ncbi:MAG: hypothetical protein LBH66_00520 [Oscillospiraceae bacterium]|nr:hypothetical protein [Oscillospiraceae bacterium]
MPFNRIDITGWLVEHRVFRYMFLLPIMAMIIFVMTFMRVLEASNAALLEEKQRCIRQDLNMIAEQVMIALGKDDEWVYDEESFRSYLISSVEVLDKQFMTYAAVYSRAQHSLEGNIWGYKQLSERNYDASEMMFDPFMDDTFRQLIASNEHQALRIVYKGDQADHMEAERELHLYFRWTPMIAGQPDRYLMVIGVSVKSLVVNIFGSIGRLVIAMVSLTTLLNVALVASIGSLARGAVKSMKAGARS